MENPDEYALGLGKLIANLLSLELLLRRASYERRTTRDKLFQSETPFDRLCVGDSVSENPFTDFSTLRDLIDRYNREIADATHPPIDRDIVGLRDALAHGRVLAPVEAPAYTLLKFSKPAAGRVRVEFAALLTPDWLKQQRIRIATEMQKLFTTT